MWQTILTHTPLLYLTQSFWRDEAFSVLASERSLGFIVTKLGFEPPVYYTLLHYWIRIFGESDIVIRCLSILGYLFATIIIIEWASTMYKKHWLAVYTPLLFFLNPMLLYYAFEVRTYAWYTFFAVSMLFSYTTKKWRWFVIAAVLGFYTHVYLLLFIGALGIHWFLTDKKNQKALRSFLVIGALMAPWLIKIGFEAARLRSSWYFPVDIRLVFSVLGNMFTGYEGTPWYGWGYTTCLSFILLGTALFALTDSKNRKRTTLFITFGLVPLAAIIGISFIKPLFVNRYLIPSTIAEILVIVAALDAIKIPWVQKVAAAGILLGTLWINWWFPPQHPKVPFRDTLAQVNALTKNSDIILADNALIYLETLYYAKDRSRVYVYNPNNAPFPWYIGDALVTPDRMIADYPPYPSRAFIVHGNATFTIAYQIPMGVNK